MMLRHADEAERKAWIGATSVFGSDVQPLLYEREERGVAERAVNALKPKRNAADSLTTNEAIVLFAFAPQNEGDLELIVGTTLVLLNSDGDWWTGHAAGRPNAVGIFPCTFVQKGKKIPVVGSSPATAGPNGPRTVVRQGWLWKKGGDTHIDQDNVLYKDRHFGKGGRRNWKQRWFMLYSDGELCYFSSADGNPGQEGGAMPKNRLRVVDASGGGASWHLRDNTDEFLLSLPGAEGDDRKALFLRHSDENERQTWIESTVSMFGATVGPLLFAKDERAVAENVVRWVRSRLSAGQGQRSKAASLTTDQALVLFEFTAQQEGDLDLRPGATLVLLGFSGDWWKGYVDGRPDVVGVFPATYVERGKVPVDVSARSSLSNRAAAVPEGVADPSGTLLPQDSRASTAAAAPLVPIPRPAAMPPVHNVNAARFARFDEDGDGVLNILEVSALVKAMGFALDPAWISDLIAKYDVDQDGALSITEFEPVYQFLESHVKASIEASEA